VKEEKASFVKCYFWHTPFMFNIVIYKLCKIAVSVFRNKIDHIIMSSMLSHKSHKMMGNFQCLTNHLKKFNSLELIVL
jgi:hypothetical protein